MIEITIVFQGKRSELVLRTEDFDYTHNGRTLYFDSGGDRYVIPMSSILYFKRRNVRGYR